MRKHLPLTKYFINKHIPDQPGYKIVELIGSGNNGHVFKAYSEDIKNYIACKIIPRQNLIGQDLSPPTWKQEIEKANVLQSRLVVKFWSLTDWIDKENEIDCVVLCSEYVRGQNLEKYLKNHKRHKGEVAITFIELFLKEMLSFLYDMEDHNVKHGDMHTKNIMVEDRSDQLGGPPYAFRVTDFGVSTATSDANFKDDYEQLAINLKNLLENVNYQFADARDKYAFSVLNDHFLARHLIEKDTTRDHLARNPRKLYERLEKIDEEFNNFRLESTETKLITPFDFLSCEQIGESHSLLKALYSNAFLGLTEIESRNNLVLTGPRGCGKSTVFKSLSLRHRVLVDDDAEQNINYIGIYYRCDDLYSVFPRYKLSERHEAYDIPIHYLTATLICEVLETIERWSHRHFEEEFSNKEALTSNKIWDVLNLKKPEEPGSRSFKSICFRLQKERKRASEKQRFANDPKHNFGFYFGPEILPKVCEIVAETFPFLQNKPFYFFIDDYSMPKITEDLQNNLNRLLMQRKSHSFFKLSTESPVSYVREDIDAKAYVEGREFFLLNLGLVYIIGEKAAKKLQFLEDIFSRRFKAVNNYPVNTLEELIGSYNGLSQNQIGLIIRDGGKPDIWGKETICNLCSGDIFYILSLVGRMVSKVDGAEGLDGISKYPKINKEIQKKAIREEAGNFLTSLRGIQNGEHLVSVVTAFGNVAHTYLLFRNSKNVSSSPPHLASRIEPLEELTLSTDAQKIYDELLRYSLFLEDSRGKSRRGKVVPRLYLRRSLLPHFNLTFSNRDSIQLEVHEIEQLILHPKSFEKEQSIKKSNANNKQQLSLGLPESSKEDDA